MTALRKTDGIHDETLEDKITAQKGTKRKIGRSYTARRQATAIKTDGRPAGQNKSQLLIFTNRCGTWTFEVMTLTGKIQSSYPRITENA